MTDLQRKWCLITGAGAGIGRATALSLQAAGAHLILCDQTKQSVDDLALEIRGRGSEALSYGVDVADLPQMERFHEWVKGEVGAIDVLVNNAGILRSGGFATTDFEDWRRVFEVNLWGVIHATKLFVPAMIDRKSGAVINVASASGVVGFSKLSAYSTSKFAVVGFSDALRGELASTGVTVSTICPGFVRTEMAKNSGLSEAEQAKISRLLTRRGFPPEKVADAILRAATEGTPMIHVGKDARVLSLLARIFPGRISRWLAQVAERGY